MKHAEQTFEYANVMGAYRRGASRNSMMYGRNFQTC